MALSRHSSGALVALSCHGAAVALQFHFRGPVLALSRRYRSIVAWKWGVGFLISTKQWRRIPAVIQLERILKLFDCLEEAFVGCPRTFGLSGF